jgi:hypothetical protein
LWIEVASSCYELALIYSFPSRIFSSSSLEAIPPVWIGSYTYNTNIIQQHIRRIPELPSHSRAPQHGVHGFRIARDSRGAEMLYEFPDAHPFASRTELLFRGFEGRDRGRGPVRAVEVPRQEAGKVLQGTQELVAADWGVLGWMGLRVADWEDDG